MERYYEQNLFPPVPAEVVNFTIIDSPMLKTFDNRAFEGYLIMAKLSDNSLASVFLIETAKGLKVDWTSTVGYQEVDWEDPPREPSEDEFLVRCTVIPFQFDTAGYPAENYLCFRLFIAQQTSPVYAYVPWSESAMAERLIPALNSWQQEPGVPKQVLLRMKPVGRVSNSYFYEVTEIVSWSWFNPE